MLLNNYFNIKKMLCLISGFNAGSTTETIYPVYDTDGEKIDTYYVNTQYMTDPLCAYSAYLSKNQTDVNRGYTYLLLGNGTTPAKADDYCMEDMITSGISGSTSNTRNIIPNTANNSVEINGALIFTVKNDGTTELTVSEVGLMYGFVWGTGSYNADPVLFFREVLETPVTIPAGGSRVFQFDRQIITEVSS